MSQLASPPETVRADMRVPTPPADDRLPIPVAALIVLALSVALWGGIALLAWLLVGG